MSAEPLIVMCVEDDADIATILRLSLALDPQIEPHVFDHAEQAMYRLSGGLRPDIILLDARLPGQSGLDFARSLAARDDLGAPRIAFVTAAAMPGQIADFHAAGAVGVITKPFDPLTFAARVRELAADGPFIPDAAKLAHNG